MSQEQTESQGFQRKPIPSGSGPVALIILDGFGKRENSFGNAVEEANKPVFNKLWETYPHTLLQASEEAVGLPEGQFGNSEVGHSNIGAGRILYQELTRINKEVTSGALYENPALKEAMAYALEHDSALHLFGLVSDGGVHSHIRHLVGLLKMAAKTGLKRVYVQAFTDGRDVAPTTGAGFLREIQDVCKELGVGQIASVQGRYYAMDRDNRWERVEKSYRAMVYGDGPTGTDPVQVLEDNYAKDVTDEFILPTTIVDDNGQPVGLVKDNDAVIMFNFRPDRAIEISRVFTNENFDGFDRGPKLPHVHYVSMTKYSETVHSVIAYHPTNLDNTLGEVLAKAGLTQLRIAETEKYPHVTFFMSGGREEKFPGEERVLIPSPKVATYDLQPEMSAPQVADAAVERILSGEIDAMILNFANPDMVGHTGDLKAAIAAIEAVDTCLGKVLDAILEKNGVAMVTADHGNADIMVDPETGGPCTTHTLSLVPFIVTRQGITIKPGILADLAPTMLDLLGVEKPAEMTGETLIQK